MLELRLEWFAGGIKETNAVAGDDGNFVLVQKENRPCVWKDSGNIRRDKTLTIRASHDDRGALPDGNNLLRIVGGDRCKCKQPLQLRKRFQDCLFQVSIEMLLDQVGDHFRVRFGSECMSVRDKLSLQAKVVLDDSVVGNNDAAFAIPVRMGILFSGPAMRGPACVTQAELAGYRLFGNQILELLQLARRAPNLKVLTLDDRDAGRVIAAVFERPEATHDDGYRIAGADVAENSTHDLTRIPKSHRSNDANSFGVIPAYSFLFRCLTQPSLMACRPRAIARDSGGTSSVTEEPAAT